MSVDNVQGGDKTVTYIKGKPVLVEQKTSEKTTGSIMVSDETTVTSSSKTNPNQVVIFPKQEKAVKESVDKVYKELADGKLTPILAEGGAGYDFCKAFSEKKMSKCLTLNGWFVDVK